jgi:RNA polymerase sigma factor (sigma-70 family)
MNETRTTAAVQQYLDDLIGVRGDSPVDPIIRALLTRAVQRLHLLCASLLHRRYPRLARPPLNLETDEVLGAVVERLLKALRATHPETVRQFFGLANQHIRWELNDLARRLDEKALDAQLTDNSLPAPESSDSGLSPIAHRMLEAIEQLPDDEREVFSLVRIQGMSQAETADLLGVSAKTIQRRLNRSLMLLTEMLRDLQPDPQLPGEA